jgi:8-oxo-dGTP pyrophosphatase MutT (NUDIX family)
MVKIIWKCTLFMAKIYEKSSGGILYRKHDKWVEILLLEWLNSKWQSEYVIPKWHMEDGETASQTALRETAEETWLEIKDLEIVKFITKLNYTFTAWYREDNPLVDKDVYLFLIKYKWTQAPTPQKEERFIGYKWFGIDEIKNLEVKFDLPSIISKNKVYFI